MGVLNNTRDTGASAVAPVAQQPVDRTGLFQNVSAGFRGAVAGPHSTQNAKAIYESRYYDQIIQALNAEGERGVDYVPSPVLRSSPFYHPTPGEKVNANGAVSIPVQRSFRNPFTSGPNPLMSYYGGGDTGETDQIWAAVQRVRQRKPDFLKALPNSGALDALADQQRQKDLAASQAITSRANVAGTVGSFIGGMAGSVASLDPENAVAGGGVGAAGKTVARTIVKRAVEGAAANAAAGIVAVPGQATDDSEHLGQEMSVGDMAHEVAQNAAVGAVIGGVHAAAPHVMDRLGQGVNAIAGKAAEAMPAPARDAIVAASIRAGTVKDRGLLTEYQKLHSPYAAVGDTSTPDERAAANVVQRDAEVREASPFHPNADAPHQDRLQTISDTLGVKLQAPDVPSPAPMQTPTVRDQSEGSTGRRPAQFSEAVNRAEGSTRNPRSSADGYGNFIDSTWLSVAPKVTDTAGMSREQILALRHDKGIAAKATDYYAAQNASYLRARGIEDSPGNLSLAHFAGPEGAAKLLKADPNTSAEAILGADAARRNPEVLKGKTAGEVVAWAHKRIGASVDGPVARPDAVADDMNYEDVPPYQTETLRPDQISTNAELMQYKSGGDENGVSGKLKDVQAWNPIKSSEIMVWQPKDGGYIVVDGHQRLGLAKRLSDEGQDINLPAIVLREEDGITAAQARVIGALRNIGIGTGSLEDNARVLRDAPSAASQLAGAEHGRDIQGLTNLSHEAFGAVLNNVIDPRIAAQVGLHAPHTPAAHMPLVGLLAKERVHSPAEAGAIVRQALADGFGSASEHQLSLLGDQPQHSLYAPIARILAAAQKKLREEKRTFAVLSEKAGKIEAAGNVLDKTANKERVIGSDEALAILDRTAHSAGPVRAALIEAARAELSGARRGDAVNRFLDALSGIDLRAAARGDETGHSFSEPPDSQGSDHAAEAQDGELAASSGTLFDHAIAARDKAEAFSDPVGEAAKSQEQMVEHDLLIDALDPATAPAPLFDAPETNFRISDEGDAKPIHEIMTEAESDETAAQAAADCLKPHIGEA